MGVRFLSPEWAQAVQSALESSEDFRSTATGRSISLQQEIKDPPEGREAHYYFKLDDGRPAMGIGRLSDADATILQDYDTAVAINRNELGVQAAFMQGRLNVSGNLMKLLQLSGVVSALIAAVNHIDVDY